MATKRTKQEEVTEPVDQEQETPKEQAKGVFVAKDDSDPMNVSIQPIGINVQEVQFILELAIKLFRKKAGLD